MGMSQILGIDWGIVSFLFLTWTLRAAACLKSGIDYYFVLGIYRPHSGTVNLCESLSILNDTLLTGEKVMGDFNIVVRLNWFVAWVLCIFFRWYPSLLDLLKLTLVIIRWLTIFGYIFLKCQLVVFCGRMFRIIYQLSSDGLFQFLQIIINLKLLLEIIAQHGLMFLWRDWLG